MNKPDYAVVAAGRPTLADIRQAHDRIRSAIHRTPVMTCAALDAMTGCTLHFKCENLQKTGAFKARGAANAVFSLTDEQAARGVVTHSSGNHGAALAMAAQKRGIPAHIVIPDNASAVKEAAVLHYGAHVHYCEPSNTARDDAAARLCADTGGTLIHPFNDFRIIAGQGTAAIELLEEVPDLDAILVPLGGGGLLSGTLIAAKAIRPDITIIGCEPAAADDAHRSLDAGYIIPIDQSHTIADGLRASLGDKTFAIIKDLVDAIALASEDAIVTAMRHTWERTKLIAEPSACLPLACLLEGTVSLPGKRVGIILSGGNVELSTLPF